MENLRELLEAQSTTPSIMGIITNIVIILILGYVVKFVYKNYYISYSSNKQVEYILIPMAMTTYLIIMVVKSSLALSLGLVGALSIVRFRTPIKEPEELFFLFLSIALGLGIGAQQIIPTSISIVSILLVYQILSKFRSKNSITIGEDLILNINFDRRLDIKKLIEKIDALALQRKLSRVHVTGTKGEITAYISQLETNSISDFIHEIEALSGVESINFYQQPHNI
jgi:uncharacterized membrane protein YhiD involved in acid resistance